MQTPPHEDLPQAIRDATPYYHIFGGVYKSMIHCATCNSSSRRYESFTVLQLEMLRGKQTLANLVASRFLPEPCDNDYICPNNTCKARGTHTKRLEITKWPQVLVVHFKRWAYNTTTRLRTKIYDFVAFPTHYRASDNVMYFLRSMIIHWGRANSGHYYAFVRDDHHGWMKYNDARTPVLVPESYVLEQRPYMVFYERARA